jgi:NADH-quinone oxidoreductase subunit J
VFARTNAVDVPALLPDGSPSPLSLSRVLTARGQMRSVGTVREDVAAIEAEITPGDRPKFDRKADAPTENADGAS